MLYKRLQELRNAYDITPLRLARFMKVSEQDILDWEAGIKEPTTMQLHELADLFDIAYEDLVDDKTKKDANKDNVAANKKKTKKKSKKRRTKAKHKTKDINKKQVEKKQNWPLLVILVFVIGLCSVGGFLYWKYGDDYAIIKKDVYKSEELVGTFSDEKEYEEDRSLLILTSDSNYTLRFHNCSIHTESKGTWSIKNNKLILSDQTSNTYTFKIHSTNKLKLTSADIGCSPLKNDIFTRGNSTITTSQQGEESLEGVSTSYINDGVWSDAYTTLQVSETTDKTARITITSYDPTNVENIASIKDVEGHINSNTLTFSFNDDGFGNRGEGSIIFDKTTAVFNITITETNETANWTIPQSATLNK